MDRRAFACLPLALLFACSSDFTVKGVDPTNRAEDTGTPEAEEGDTGAAEEVEEEDPPVDEPEDETGLPEEEEEVPVEERVARPDQPAGIADEAGHRGGGGRGAEDARARERRQDGGSGAERGGRAHGTPRFRVGGSQRPALCPERGQEGRSGLVG